MKLFSLYSSAAIFSRFCHLSPSLPSIIFRILTRLFLANLHEKRGFRLLNFLKDFDMLIVKVFGQLYYCVFVVACFSGGFLVSDSLLYVQMLQLFIQLFPFDQKLRFQCLHHVFHHRILLWIEILNWDLDLSSFSIYFIYLSSALSINTLLLAFWVYLNWHGRFYFTFLLLITLRALLQIIH